jgi:hypothetical protein
LSRKRFLLTLFIFPVRKMSLQIGCLEEPVRPSKETVVVGSDGPAASTSGITSTDRLEIVRGQYESSGL